jgi:hypothetical protein
MAKVNGLGWTALNVDDSGGSANDIREDVNSLEYATPQNLLEVTGIDKSAMERLGGLKDFTATVNFTADFDASDSVFDVFKDTGTVRTFAITVAAQILSNETLISEVNWNRGTDGSLSGSASVALANGTVPTWTT